MGAGLGVEAPCGRGSTSPLAEGKGYHRELGSEGSHNPWIRMRLGAFLEKKKAVRHQNRRIPTRWLEEQGYKSLCSLLT